MVVTLDTGTDENWISQRIVDRLNLEVKKGFVTRWRAFDGRKVESDSTVKAAWSSCGRGISHVSVFRVVSDAPFDTLFGHNLIFSPEVNLSPTGSVIDSVLAGEHGPETVSVLFYLEGLRLKYREEG